MDTSTARYLGELDTRFYEENAASFSRTRDAPWEGWQRLVRMLPADGGAALSVADVACGNRRLERFLREALPDREIRYLGIDGCAALAAMGPDSRVARVDLVRGLLDGTLPPLAGLAPSCGLVACFGFLHHVPGQENRVRFLRWLVDGTGAGGLVAVSLWRFLDDGRLSRRADETTARARGELEGLDFSQLEKGDRFLGWQGRAGALRYCHGFDDAEADALVSGVAGLASPVARYRADGASGRLNEYLVLRAG